MQVIVIIGVAMFFGILAWIGIGLIFGGDD